MKNELAVMNNSFRQGIISVLIGFSFSVSAGTLQQPLDEVTWLFEGDRFYCQLRTELKHDGDVTIVARSAQSMSLKFNTTQRPDIVDEALLYVNHTPWLDSATLSPLLKGQPEGEFGVVFKDTALIKQLLQQMERGAWAKIGVQHRQYQQLTTWPVPTVNFQPPYQAMKQCLMNLLPMDFEAAKNNELYFPTGGYALSNEDTQLIKEIVEFIHHDDSASHRILIDGHTDNQGERLTNLTLSRKRAEAVKSAFVAAGVPSHRIHIRSHGQRYPKVSNQTVSQRHLNRRVQVRLQRGEAI